jgi:hypothetical protein
MEILQQFINSITPNMDLLSLNSEEKECLLGSFNGLLEKKKEHWGSHEKKEDMITILKVGMAINERCFLITGQIDFFINTVRWAGIEELELNDALDMMNEHMKT